MAIRTFGADSGVPEAFFSRAMDGLNEIRLLIAKWKATFAYFPPGRADLNAIVNVKQASLAEVRAGTLSPEKWTSGLDELRTNIVDVMNEFDRTSTFIPQMVLLFTDIKNDLLRYAKKAAEAGKSSLGIFIAGAGAYLAWRLFSK